MRAIFAGACLASCLAAWAQDNLAQLYSEATQAQTAGDLAAATQKYQAIIKLRPQMAEAYANLGNLYYQQRQTDRARSAYQKAVELKPSLAGPHFFLGVIAFGAHDYVTALDHLKRAEALQPSNAQIHAHVGYTEYAQASYRAAAAEFEKATALDATNIDVLYHLSKSYGQLAKDSFLQLKKQFPDSPYTDLARAHAAETEENWKTAAQQYGLALNRIPGNARLEQKARWTAAKAADINAPPPDAGMADEWIDGSLAYKDSQVSGPALKELISRFQTKAHGLENAAVEDKQAYLAGEAYQVLSYLASLAVYELDPDSYRAHQLRAQFMEASNKDEDAIAEYQNVLIRNPGVQNIHFAIGSLYWKDQRFAEARAELEAELKINPNHPDALYELGDIAAFFDDPKAAEKYFLGALKLRPNLIEAHYGIEKICTQSGRYQESLANLRTILAIDPSQATAHYRLATVYRKMGRQRDAEKELALYSEKRQ